MKVFKPKGLGDLISQASERPICEGPRVKFIRLSLIPQHYSLTLFISA